MSTTCTLPCMDSRWIAQTFAFRRQLTRPEPVTDRWMLPGQAYGSVLRDSTGQWRMWYLDDPIYTEYYATSRDGVSWDRPDLKLGLSSRHGPVQPNIIMSSPQRDAHGRWLSGIKGPEGFCVLDATLTPHPAAKARFTALYLARWAPGESAGHHQGLCIAHSEDGITWTAGEHNAVIPGWLDTGNIFYYDTRRQRYVVFGRPTACVDLVTHANRVVARCESEDLIHWTPFQTVLDTEDLDADPQSFIDEAVLRSGGQLTATQQAAAWAQITEGAQTKDQALIRGRNRQWYGMTVFPYHDIYLGIGMMYDIPTGYMWLELLHSYDSVDWRRETIRTPWLGDDALRWDYPMIVPAASPPVLVGEEAWVYYSATAKTHHGKVMLKDDAQPLRAIGACKVRQDRWAGYVAGQQQAELLTHVLPECETIRLDAQVREGGSLRVHACDRDGNALPGYELEQCEPIAGDGSNLVVKWKNSSTPISAGGEIRLRIVATHATLFALHMDK